MTATLTLNRAQWRMEVERELALIGAAVHQLPTGSWRVAKGDAYFVLADLAELKARDLRHLAKA